MSPDSVQIITTNYGKLSKNEKAVADYLLNHLDGALAMSIYELADTCGVSAAVLVRMAKKMGFAGYRELRLHLAQSRPLHEDLFLDLNSGASGDVRGSVEKALRAEMDSILVTLEQLNYAVLADCTVKLRQAQRVLLFGCSTSYVACCDEAIKLRKIGKTAFTADSLDSAAAMLSGFAPGDAVIVVSHSGETEAAVRVLKLASRLGMFTLAVTTFPESPVGREAEQVLCTQTRESPLHKIALTSRISQLAMMDALFMAYFTANYEECRARMNSAAAFLEEMKKN